jgi:hypothetical protein
LYLKERKFIKYTVYFAVEVEGEMWEYYRIEDGTTHVVWALGKYKQRWLFSSSPLFNILD